MSLVAITVVFAVITVNLVQLSHQQENDPTFMAFFNKTETDCCQEEGIETSYIDNLWNTNTFPNDTKVKCYYKCIAVKLGIMDDKGDVVDDTLKKVSAEFVGTTDDNAIASNCKSVAQGSDLCETGNSLMQCVRNNSN